MSVDIKTLRVQDVVGTLDDVIYIKDAERIIAYDMTPVAPSFDQTKELSKLITNLLDSKRFAEETRKKLLEDFN